MINITEIDEQSGTRISDFYSDRDIFITGATGFIGKVLIEKLLYSCPNLNNIFILTRPKKGYSSQERLSQLFACPIFQRIKEFNASLLNKVNIIAGDVSEINLGIAEKDIHLLENVSIIYHIAASVRFDDTLQRAILLNTRGTREVMLLALNLKNIKSIIHTSTTYSNPDKLYVEEKIYPAHWNWKTAIRMAENCDLDVLATLTDKLTDYFPNTYTFTKGLAEQVCEYYKDKLPITIFRPSIVINMLKDPIPGWVDNFNGLCGIFVTCGIGLQRTMLSHKDTFLNLVPVDVCVNGLIISSWVKGTGKSASPIPIYNCSPVNNIRTLDLVNMSKKLCHQSPFQKIIWMPGGALTNCKFYYYYRIVLYQILPGIVIDGIIKLFRKKPFILKIQRITFNALKSISYFATRDWQFKSVNYDSLTSYLDKRDSEEYSLDVDSMRDLEDFTNSSILGCRRFLLKQSDEKLENDRKKIRFLYIADQIIKYLKIIFVMYFLANFVIKMFASN